jgi:hypothetical protein
LCESDGLGFGVELQVNCGARPLGGVAEDSRLNPLYIEPHNGHEILGIAGDFD